MELPLNITVESEKGTLEFANQFASILKPSDIVAFNGDLGTGKTFIIKEIAKYFSVKEVTSPTFSIVNTYSGDVRINHFDFYRIKKVEELYDIGFEEYLSDSSAITFIEWADMFPEILPNNIYRIYIKYLDNYKREISLKRD